MIINAALTEKQSTVFYMYILAFFHFNTYTNTSNPDIFDVIFFLCLHFKSQAFRYIFIHLRHKAIWLPSFIRALDWLILVLALNKQADLLCIHTHSQISE